MKDEKVQLTENTGDIPANSEALLDSAFAQAHDQAESIIQEPAQIQNIIEEIADTLDVPPEIITESIYEDKTKSDKIKLSSLVIWIFFFNLVILTIGIATFGGFAIAKAAECSQQEIQEAIIASAIMGVAVSAGGAKALTKLIESKIPEEMLD